MSKTIFLLSCFFVLFAFTNCAQKISSNHDSKSKQETTSKTTEDENKSTPSSMRVNNEPLQPSPNKIKKVSPNAVPLNSKIEKNK